MTGESKPRFRPWRVLLILAGTTVSAAIAATWMLTPPFSEPAWVEAPPHPTSIYESSLAAGVPVVSPFHIEIQPMHSLLLVNFEGDPDRIPLVLDGTRMTFVRYSTRPFIVTWNPTVNARAEVLAAGAQTVPDMSVLDANGVRYALTSNGPFREIRRMWRREGGQEVTVDFAPAIPHLLALRDGADVSGAFRIATEPPAGLVTGTWRIVRQDRRLRFEATPSGGWTPGEAPPMARALFRVISMFRTWPTTYSWTATLHLPEPGEDVESSLPLESAWERIER